MPETYAAAMQPEVDWGVGNPMNEFRNRRTDVTPQFLYQYGLHFKLPKDWNPEVRCIMWFLLFFSTHLGSVV